MIVYQRHTLLSALSSPKFTILRQKNKITLVCNIGTQSRLWDASTLTIKKKNSHWNNQNLSSYFSTNTQGKPVLNDKNEKNTNKSNQYVHPHSPSCPSKLVPLTPEEELIEKTRVSGLTKYEKQMELRDLDAQIARLQTCRGINTGEYFTIRGKFKALARDYGAGFLAWYYTVWTSMFAMSYGAITFGEVDVLQILGKIDAYTGWELASRIDPSLGTIALALALNEVLEIPRLPFVVLTTKPVVNFFTGGAK